MTYSRDVAEAMANDYRRTRSCVETARKFGCSPHTVTRYVRQFGHAVRPTGGRHKQIGEPPRWRRSVQTNGYVVWTGWAAGKNWLISEHRLVMEKALGRSLLTREQVHHKNGDRTDNRLENLEIRVSHGPGATHCRHCGGLL